jgi:lipopolysaccharide transport system ATP-binding protein
MNNSTAHELPDDVVLSVRHVSKKFCRNLRRSMWYGMQDLGRNLFGIRPKAGEGGALNGKRETLSVNRPRQDSNLLATVHDSCLSNNSSVGSNDSRLTNNPAALGGSLRRDEFWAVENVSFDLHRGEILGIIGANGSGNRTIMRLQNAWREVTLVP